MKNPVFLSFIILLCAGYSSAQDSLKPIKRIRINDIGAQLSAINVPYAPISLAEFRDIYPESTLLKTDLSAYSEQRFQGFSFDPGISFFAGANFRFANKDKSAYRKNIRLRAGLAVNSFKLYSLCQQETTKPFDSIQPSIVLDSLIQRNYYMGYSGNQLRADVSFLWSTSQEKRKLALYTGLGISAGISLQSRNTVTYSVYRDLVIRDRGTSYVDRSGEINVVSEQRPAAKNYSFSAYIPLGADLQLGKVRKFWTRTHLYYELRPFYNVLMVDGSKTFTNLGIQHGWGLRFKI